MTAVAVIGTTSWGTTLAAMLAGAGHEVVLLARTAAEASVIQRDRENKRHRPGLPFPPALIVSHERDRLNWAAVVVFAVPSASLRINLEALAASINVESTILSATKGIEAESCLRMSEVIAGAGIDPARIVALSGPNFAREIAAGLPAATVVAGSDSARALAVQALFNMPAFRVYTSNDIAGVEIGGALKNVVAIACGLSDGLGYGENAKAALITRALAEITRLGVAHGARPMTFLGLAGIGDLILTCESDLSRNRRLGLALASGSSLEEALSTSEGVVEGVVTARCVPELCHRAAVEMPICTALHAVLYEGVAPKQAVVELMGRAAKPEFD
jgi:glycerol-3-phosphate dehydrogenase (NAD(P)+)